MTETNKRSRKTESVRDLDEQRQSVEAELVEGQGKPLTCREKTSTATEGIARKESSVGTFCHVLSLLPPPEMRRHHEL